jgi:hypothetical protein
MAFSPDVIFELALPSQPSTDLTTLIVSFVHGRPTKSQPQLMGGRAFALMRQVIKRGKL